jgi:phosphate:Na+ symporter
MASEGLLSLPAGIALALGANIGTCVTALLAAIGKPTEAVRAAVVHISFNILGVLVWLPLLSVLADMATWISPVAENLQGTAKLAAETPRQIANANTMFNVINTILFISFTTWFARLAQWLVPEKKLPEGIIIQPEFLNADALKAPSVALENVRQEINRAGEITVSMLQQLGPAMEGRDRTRLDAIAKKDDEVDILETEILKYLGRLRQGLLSEKESHEHQGLMTAMVNLESLADVIETDLVALAKRFIRQEYRASEKTGLMISELYEAVCQAVVLAVQAVGRNDQRAAENVLLMKSQIADLAMRLSERQAQRLKTEDPQYLNKIRLQMAFIEQLRRIYTLAKRIARTNLPIEVAVEPA